MIVRATYSIKFVALCLLLTSCTDRKLSASNSTNDGRQYQQISGHTIVKIHNDENGHVNLNAPLLIFQDKGGKIWVTNDLGVCVYDEQQNKWECFTKDILKLPQNRVEAIGQSSDQKIWVASIPVAKPNLSYFDGKQWIPFQNTSTSVVVAIFPGRDEKLWFASLHKIKSYSSQGWSRPYNVARAMQNEEMLQIKAGLQDSEGYIWLAIKDGIVKFDEQKNEWKLKRKTETITIPHRIYEDRKGRIWFITMDGYAWVHDKARDSLISYKATDHVPADEERSRPKYPGVPEVWLNDIFQDKAGRMMFATSKGLLIFNEQADKKWELFTSQNSALPDSNIKDIFEDRTGRIWIGTGAGIVVLEP